MNDKPLMFICFGFILLGLAGQAGLAASQRDMKDKTNPRRDTGLKVRKLGTPLAYITHNGKPLLAFGCHFEHMFFRENDYESWSSWAAAHGINHCRARVIQPKIDDAYIPYVRTDSGKFDLTRFDPAFWQRFRAICTNLQSHGIIMHLLLFPHNSSTRNSSWRTHCFNPKYNINQEATSHLSPGTVYEFWHSVADDKAALCNIQMATLEKIVEETADLDNIYYDISHELRDCCPKGISWDKAKQTCAAMAEVITTKYRELQPGKTPLLGLDSEHFYDPVDQDWNFGNPHFNLLIKGNSNCKIPSLAQIRGWRKTYGKPFVLQEGWDVDVHNQTCLKMSYHSADRTYLRKFVWKWMMTKNQLIDIYQKGYKDPQTGVHFENYDPKGHNRFAEDALVLRQFWNTLTDYPNLDFRGVVKSEPGRRQMVLSSRTEAIVYLASGLSDVGIHYPATSLKVTGLALTDGSYEIAIWKPIAPDGRFDTLTKNICGGEVSLGLPTFVDDLVLHFYRD